MKENLEDTKKESSFLVPFLVGGLIGAGIALLLAPKSGRELRQDIKDVASKTRDTVAETVEKGKDLYEESTAAVKDLYEESTTAVKGAIEAGKMAYIQERDKHRQAV